MPLGVGVGQSETLRVYRWDTWDSSGGVENSKIMYFRYRASLPTSCQVPGMGYECKTYLPDTRYDM